MVASQYPYDQPLLPAPHDPALPYKRGAGRDAEAARLQALGWDLEEIGARLHLDDGDPVRGARRAAEAVKRAMAEAVSFSRDEQRLIQVRAMQELRRRLWDMMQNTSMPLIGNKSVIFDLEGNPLEDYDFKLRIMDRILRVEEQMAKFQGTYAPTQTVVLTPEVLEAEIARLEAELGPSAVAPAAEHRELPPADAAG